MLCKTCNENINTKTTINSFTIIHFFGTLVLYQDWRGLLCVPSAARALLLRLQWPPISPCSRKSSLYLQWQRKRDGERERERERERKEKKTAHLDRKFSQFCQTENNIRVLHFPGSQTILEESTDLSWPLRGLLKSRYRFMALQKRIWLVHFREEPPLKKDFNLCLHVCF